MTILDADRSLVSIIANDDLGNEDSTPIDNGQFTVSLSQFSPTDTVVNYTVSGTANGGTDYTALSGTVTILAGQTSATIDVSVLNDLLLDSDETVIVTLSGTNNSLITVDENNNTDTVTIMDEDRLVSIVANDDLGNEDNTPIDNGQFTVSLTRATSSDTVVSYTVSGTANGGTDYTALSGTVTVLAGETTAIIDVSVLNDELLDSDETVIVTLSGTNDTNIRVDENNNMDTVTILDDDVSVVPENLLSLNENNNTQFEISDSITTLRAPGAVIDAVRGVSSEYFGDRINVANAYNIDLVDARILNGFSLRSAITETGSNDSGLDSQFPLHIGEGGLTPEFQDELIIESRIVNKALYLEINYSILSDPNLRVIDTKATQVNGEVLPDWFVFDEKTGGCIWGAAFGHRVNTIKSTN